MEEDSLNSPSRFRDPHGILVIRDVRSILEHTEARSFVALDLGKLGGEKISLSAGVQRVSARRAGLV